MTPKTSKTKGLQVRNLRVEIPTRRGVLVAIDDLSFDIAPGEVLGMVGESGAGKSITGSAIIGLLEPPGHVASGEILLDGQRIDNLPPERMRYVRGKRIGMIFQDPLTSLDPLYRIGDQLTETIRTHEPMSRHDATEKAVRLLEEVGIPAARQRLSSYPHQFSGGMRQRVVIALALAADPELVIADEPTTALDVSVQAQIIALLKRICADRGASVLLITHDMGVIAETCDRVCVLYAGRLAEIGPVRDVVKHPQHPYSQGLMAAIPSLADDPDEKLAQIPGSMPRLGAIPDGCAFNPRCGFAWDRCRAERPPAYPADGSMAACFLHDPEAEPPREIIEHASHAGLSLPKWPEAAR
jgi:peptide/nickel transport system ATP-binding protein